MKENRTTRTWLNTVLVTALSLVYQLLPLLLLQSVAVADAGCHFPASIQTNRSSRHRVDAANSSGVHHQPRDWVTRVRDQYTVFDHRLIVSGNVIRTVPSSAPLTATATVATGSSRRGGGGREAAGPVIHTRVCLQTVNGDRYLVVHEEPAGQRGGGQTRYACLQFVLRSSDVFQIRSSQVSDRMDRSLCQDSALSLDPWLVVDRNHLGRERAPCPLVGGFSMHIFDKSRNEGVCDAYLGETRLEGDCQKDDGLIFRFRRQTCVPQDLYMIATQPVTCLTTWIEQSTSSPTTASTGPGRGGGTASNVNVRRFTLLRHPDAHHSYFWLMRTPDSLWSRTSASGSSDQDQFTAYIINDLVADTLNQVNETRNYIRLDVVRDRPRSISEICSDDYEICNDQMSASGTGNRARAMSRCTSSGQTGLDFRLACPLTCGLCNASNPSRCRLPSSWAGQWRMQSGNGNWSGSRALTIGETAMTSSPDGENWHCIEWQKPAAGDGGNMAAIDDGTEKTELMLVSDFTNGCRPRFRCVRVLRRSSALIYLQFSRSSPWPFNRVAGSEYQTDCSAFRYDLPPPTHSHFTSFPADQRNFTSSRTTTASTSGSYTIALYNSDEVLCDLPPSLLDFRIASSASEDASGGNRSASAAADCIGSLTESDLGTRLELDVRCHDVRQLPPELEPGLTSFVCLDSSRSVTSSSGEETVLVARLLSYSADGDLSSDANLPLYCWVFSESSSGYGGSSGVSQVRQFQMFVGAKCESVVQRYSAVQRDARPRPGQDLLPPATAVFTKSVRSEPQTTTPPPSVADRLPTSKRVPNGARSTKSPRTTTLPPSEGQVDDEPMSPETVTVVDKNGGVPRTQNSTSPEADESTVSAEQSKNVVAVAAVIFILAVIQAVVLCRC